MSHWINNTSHSRWSLALWSPGNNTARSMLSSVAEVQGLKEVQGHACEQDLIFFPLRWSIKDEQWVIAAMKVTERLAGMNKCHLRTIYHICECQPRLSKDLEMDGWRLTIVLCTYVDLKLYCPKGNSFPQHYTSDNNHSVVRHNNRQQPRLASWTGHTIQRCEPYAHLH